jgi:hypothetical protein
MREELKQLSPARRKFIATFSRYGEKPSWRFDRFLAKPSKSTFFKEKTLLFVDVRLSTGTIVTDHIWFSMTKGFNALGTLEAGDVVSFEARVKPYTKGRRHWDEDDQFGFEIDYKLSFPTNIKRVFISQDETDLLRDFR